MIKLITPRSTLVRNMSIFTKCYNPLTGTDTWKERDKDYDYHQEIARSGFADMLHDYERNAKYYLALKLAIDKKHDAGEQANVLDIGTGTGLLSMMAAYIGADTITACEAFAPMAKCAATIIRKNGYAGRINLVQKRSTKMTVGKDGDMPKRANILVTEVFDTELIGEGALSTFRHAHEVLLEKNSIVVPHSATVWVQVIESSAVRTWNRINSIKDIDSQQVLLDTPLSINQCVGSSVAHDIQLSQLPDNSFTPLLPPQPIFRFDWSGNIPLTYDEKVRLTAKPISSGTAHAIFMWWELSMDTEKEIVLSCAPVWEHPVAKECKEQGVGLDKLVDEIPWRDHWMQAVYYFPVEIPITIDKEVNLIGYHDEYSFWFQLQNEINTEIPNSERPACSCCAHIIYSRTRIGQLNDEKRNQKYIEALRTKITPDSVCLCLSDGCLLGLAAARLGAKKIYVLESISLSQTGMEILIDENGLSEKVQIIESVDCLPPNDEINLIFAEPYFISSIVPWENLRYWYLIANYSPQIERIPIAATIRGVAVEFENLHKIRAPLDTCTGFDLSSFDNLVQYSSERSDAPVEAQPLWEYPGRALCTVFDVVRFDFTKNVNNLERTKELGTVSISQSGSCNGIALWVDWQLDTEITVSTGPIQEVIPGERITWDRFTKQGVFLFRRISNVTNQSVLSWSFSFDPADGNINFQFDITQET